MKKDFICIFVYWIVMYVSARLAALTRMSPLVFYLIIGCALGNIQWGDDDDPKRIIYPSAQITWLAEVAIAIVFLALGFEESVENFMGGIKRSWGIASIGAIVPFGCGFFCAWLFYRDEGFECMLMCGLAVTATAVSLTMIALRSEGLAVSKAAIGIMTSAVLDDVMCLALVAIMLPLVGGGEVVTVVGVIKIVGMSLLFFLVIAILHIVVFPHDKSHLPLIRNIPILNSVGVHQMLVFKSGEQSTLATIFIGLGGGLLATAFGFHPAIGAYMTGLILHESYYEIDHVQLQESRTLTFQPMLESARLFGLELTAARGGWQGAVVEDVTGNSQAYDHGVQVGWEVTKINDVSVTDLAFEVEEKDGDNDAQSVIDLLAKAKEATFTLEFRDAQQDDHGHHHENVHLHVMEMLENIAYCWFGPMFFVNLGADITLEMDIIKEVWWQGIVIYVVLFWGQVLSAALAAKYVPGGFTWTQSWMIGFGMLGRAELFFVVLNQCRALNVITKRPFFALVVAAVLLDITVPIAITLFKPIYNGQRTYTYKKIEATKKPARRMSLDAESMECLMMAAQRANRDELLKKRRCQETEMDDVPAGKGIRASTLADQSNSKP